MFILLAFAFWKQSFGIRNSIRCPSRHVWGSFSARPNKLFADDLINFYESDWMLYKP
jgi:hypothetical protein